MSVSKILSLFKRSKRPNVLFITVDQFRQDRLDVVPFFRELRNQGVLFSQVVTYAPYTLASMHAIYTGMYGYRNRVNAYYGSDRFDDEGCRTLTSYLKDAGYWTRGDFLSKITVPHQGFDAVTVHDEFSDDLVARHKEILQECARQRPFYLYLHYSKIHTDMVERVIKRYDDFSEEYFSSISENSARYTESAQRAGRYLAEIFAESERLALSDSTLFVVITDHGCSVGERRGEKCYGVFTYEYTVRCFCYLIWPGALPAGREVATAVRTIDIMPTILDLLKLKPSKRFKPMQGESLVPLIESGHGSPREAFIETGGLGGPHPSPHQPNIKCLRTGEWKLIYNTTTNQRELYHLTEDPNEMENLWGRYPEIQEKLWLRLQEHLD